PQLIQRWWRKWPDANIGIPTGAENGFWVVEADTKAGHGKDGIAALQALIGAQPWPATLQAISPSGSVHYYFQYPEGMEVKNSASKIAAGVDMRGEGGMVLAPPSVRDDGIYQWRNAGTPIAVAPPWLLALVTEQPRNTDT